MPYKLKTSLILSLIILSIVGVGYFKNTLFWICLTLTVIFTSTLLLELKKEASNVAIIRNISRPLIQNTTMVIVSAIFVVLIGELIVGSKIPITIITPSTDNNLIEQLSAAENYQIPLNMEARQNILDRSKVFLMPEEWARYKPKGDEKAKLFKENAIDEIYLEGDEKIRVAMVHGTPHFYDKHKFRRKSPLPNKKNSKFRILAIGDSMTFGYGVDDRFIYPSLIERLLSETNDVEVINIGKSGWQSEDILRDVKIFLPQLKPDLVIYGMVLNDFLPLNKGEYWSRGYLFPLPKKFKTYLINKSRLVKLSSQSYDAILRKLHLRKDFYDDILEDFDSYQERFRKDVFELNQYVVDFTGYPIIATVLDQAPRLDSRGHKISKIAEKHMIDSGMNFIAINEYYSRYNGFNFSVSRWEGHGNELVHAIWASMYLSEIKKYLPSPASK
jgi:hypothetical protein